MPTTTQTPRTYADLISAQEDAQECPNEVVYHFAQLTGADHYEVHQALVALNPVMSMSGHRAVLTLPDVAALVGRLAAGHEAQPRW